MTGRSVRFAAASGVLEQGLRDAGLSHSGEANKAHGLVRGSHKVPDALDSVFDIELARVLSAEGNRYAGLANQFVTVARKGVGPPSEGLPALEWNTEDVSDPQRHTWVPAKPVGEFAAAVELGLQIADGTDLVVLIAHRVAAPGCGTAGGIVVEANDDVTPIGGGELREDGSEFPIRRHLGRNLRGRHGRFLDLDAGSGPRYEVTAKVVERATDGATAYTDEASAYTGMPFNHESVKHSAKEYVRGMVHTNGIESFWSMLKRAYIGTYHKLSPKHLNRYVLEFAGKNNIRDLDTPAQMTVVVAALVGRRLMYRDLIAPNGLPSGARGGR